MRFDSGYWNVFLLLGKMINTAFAMQASWVQLKHCNSTHESRSGTAFVFGIAILLLQPAGLRGQVAQNCFLAFMVRGYKIQIHKQN